ncbi:nuclear transport factor 2 family protein [Nocardioides psychrotolerans]|uniref:nuclear transport factor 2 family protein n=1 Tax=Nocardioides psychrotolerans TaxID=1005945 RepID=UPI0031384335
MTDLPPDLLPDLPPVVAAYVAADAGTDLDAFVALFAETAVVVDDGRTFSGREGVRSWKAQTTSEFTYETSLVSHERLAAGQHRVVGHLTGDFPGGEVDLTYTFVIAEEVIERLEIDA